LLILPPLVAIAGGLITSCIIFARRLVFLVGDRVIGGRVEAVDRAFAGAFGRSGKLSSGRIYNVGGLIGNAFFLLAFSVFRAFDAFDAFDAFNAFDD